MIDIIGNIKIDEAKPSIGLAGKMQNHIRVNFLLASLMSYDFLCEHGATVTVLCNDPSVALVNVLKAYNKQARHPFTFLFPSLHSDYGVAMRTMLKNTANLFVLQFEEDHFCSLNNHSTLFHMLDFAKKTSADVIRASFFDVETQSAEKMKAFTWHETGKCYEMHPENFKSFNHKWPRYYLGTNCIFSKEFAKRFYSRPGTKPHEYELSEFTPQFKHNCIIPNYEILRSIDDDHDTPNTCMMKQPTVKFLECMEKADKLMKSYYK